MPPRNRRFEIQQHFRWLSASSAKFDTVVGQHCLVGSHHMTSAVKSSCFAAARSRVTLAAN